MSSALPPAISVVVPTYRRPELLRRCLDRLLAQHMAADGGFEVIVVDDGHDAATLALVEELAAGHPEPRLQYLRPARGRGPAVARNAGWRAAHADIVAFTDDDTMPEPEWLAHGLRTMHAQAGWSALAGRVRVPLDPPAGRRPTDHELMTLGLERAEFVTANAFVRRAALERIGGFDERFTRAWREDSDLQFRLMREVGPVGREDGAVVLHPARAEPWGVCLRQQRNAFFEALLFRNHPVLYRQRISAGPPWLYYVIVIAFAMATIAAASGASKVAEAAGSVGAVAVLVVTARRLRRTSLAPAHAIEMLATSALIPFLSVYWRLRGALRFRVPFI